MEGESWAQLMALRRESYQKGHADVEAELAAEKEDEEEEEDEEENRQ